MDKIREEFEKQWRIIDGNNYPFDKQKLCFIIYKSRDEKIKHLKQDCKNLITVNKNQDVIMQFRTDHVKELYHQVCIHKEKIEKLEDALGAGRDYLMTVKANDITVEDCLEAFGFGRNGLKENE